MLAPRLSPVAVNVTQIFNTGSASVCCKRQEQARIGSDWAGIGWTNLELAGIRWITLEYA